MTLAPSLTDVSVFTVIVTLGVAPFVFGPYLLFVARYDGNLSIPWPVAVVVGVVLAAPTVAAVWGRLAPAFATPFAIALGAWAMQNPRTAAYYDQQRDSYSEPVAPYDDESDVPFAHVLLSWLGGAAFVLVGLYLAIGTILGTVG